MSNSKLENKHISCKDKLENVMDVFLRYLRHCGRVLYKNYNNVLAVVFTFRKEQTAKTCS